MRTTDDAKRHAESHARARFVDGLLVLVGARKLRRRALWRLSPGRAHEDTRNVVVPASRLEEARARRRRAAALMEDREWHKARELERHGGAGSTGTDEP